MVTSPLGAADGGLRIVQDGVDRDVLGQSRSSEYEEREGQCAQKGGEEKLVRQGIDNSLEYAEGGRRPRGLLD